jgi:hypothetical protein
MNDRYQTTTAIVRCAVRRGTSEAQREAIDHLLTARAWRATKVFEAKDDDELNQEARAGRFDVIVFPDLDALLGAIWKEDADLSAWEAAGVRLELAVPPPGDHWRNVVRAVSDSHARWRRASRTREILAGVILSILALAAAAVLLWR